jgi:pyrimidine operon attenuation protein/uracil phosphoribosyltransferase
MANRNFQPGAKTLERELVKIYAKAQVGIAGAVSGIEGSGVSTITAETGASGKYSITLEDVYSKFMFGSVALAAAVQGIATTAVTGTSEAAKLTFVAKNACTAGDFAVITDTSGNEWAVAVDVAGTDPEPTSALWAAIPAARKANVDISGATTDANVATAMRAGLAGLTDIGTVITVASSSGADVPWTHVLRANVANVAVYKKDGAATPSSMTATTTTAGIATAVNVTDNTITFVAHGLYTGRAIALSINSGSLPAGTSATTYYAIVVDANTIKLGSSLANAEAGTAVDITDYGDATKTMTITPSAVLGSQVARVEFVDTVAANTLTAGKLYFNAYNTSGAAIQIANGTTMFIELTLRNSTVKSKGEA